MALCLCVGSLVNLPGSGYSFPPLRASGGLRSAPESFLSLGGSLGWACPQSSLGLLRLLPPTPKLVCAGGGQQFLFRGAFTSADVVPLFSG